MAFYYDELRECEADIRSIKDVRGYCDTLYSQNSEMEAGLSSLASSLASSVKLENPGDLEQKVRQLCADNVYAIQDIVAACDTQIAVLEEKCENYRELNRKEHRRLDRERRQGSGNVWRGGRNV